MWLSDGSYTTLSVSQWSRQAYERSTTLYFSTEGEAGAKVGLKAMQFHTGGYHGTTMSGYTSTVRTTPCTAFSRSQPEMISYQNAVYTMSVGHLTQRQCAAAAQYHVHLRFRILGTVSTTKARCSRPVGGGMAGCTARPGPRQGGRIDLSYRLASAYDRSEPNQIHLRSPR